MVKYLSWQKPSILQSLATFGKAVTGDARNMCKAAALVNQRSLYCRRFWQWQTGMSMFVIGNVATFVARGMWSLWYNCPAVRC